MKKPISKDLHGLIDYSYAIIVPMLPEFAGFTNETAATAICRGLGAGALSYSLVTRARWGIIRILPFKAHLAIDFSVSCLALATPWLFGFSRNAAPRNTLLATGLLGLGATLLTKPQDEPNSEQRHLFI